MINMIPFDTFRKDCENYYEEDFSKIPVTTKEVNVMIAELYNINNYEIDYKNNCIIY